MIRAPLRGLTASAFLLVAAAAGAAAQQGGAAGDTAAAADTLRARADTLQGVRDTLAAAADTVTGAAADTMSPSVEEVRAGLAGGDFPQKDSVFRALVERPGYRAVEYRARRVVLEVPERTVRLRDSAQINYGDAALRADSILYRSRLQFMVAHGDIRLLSPEQRELTTDSVLYYDVSRLKGTVLDAHTSFAQGGTTWNVTGDAIPLGQNTLYVETGTFTSCTLEHPHYYFKANQIKMVSRDVLVAWPVVFYISDVPVFWLPFFAQDIRPDRRSGILPPRFGFNTVVALGNDPNRQVTDGGFYWAINRFMDASFTADWYSGRWSTLTGDFRYRILKKFLSGNVAVSRTFSHQPSRGDNLQVRFSHDQRLTPQTRLSANGRYVQSATGLQERSFDQSELTQTIESNVGLQHRADFASISLSARRNQYLSGDGKVDLTLPSLNVSFSPVTLFEAPRNRAGFFNNMTWRGSGSFTRDQTTRDIGDDRFQTTGRMNQSLSVGRLSLSSSGSFRQTELDRFRVIPPEDSASADTAFVNLDRTLETTVDWSNSASFQIGLFGSTTLSPTLDVSGGWFRSRTPPDSVRGDTVPDTDGAFVQSPTRFSAGANLSTDLYGFFPGFGTFERIRHKISPRFQWRYRPRVTLEDSALAAIPGFPGGTGAAQNELTISLNQTFEAKVGAREGGEPESGRAGRAEGDTAETGRGGEDAGPGTPGAAPDTLGAAPDTAGAPGDTLDGDGGATGGRRSASGQERKVTLLSIRSDALRFDFERAKEGEPVLVTDSWGNSLSSDLLRGVSLTITHDLFEGTGADRKFSPALTAVTASFSLRSGQGLSDIFGLGGGGGGGGGGLRNPAAGTGPGGFGRSDSPGATGPVGQWNLSLNYSLRRSREGGSSGFGGGDSQSLGWSLSLNPTPNWSMRWSTGYNITNSEFTHQNVSLTRDLHRWRAEFDFRKTSTGNFSFSILVRLMDAPDLRIPYERSSR